MNALKWLSTAFLLISIPVSGCTHEKVEPQIDNEDQCEQYKEEIIKNLKEKYQAIDLFSLDVDFSAEISDGYIGQNMYSEIIDVDDIFYSDGELFMYTESWYGESFMLNITSEQYSMIRTFNNDFADFDLYVIFSLEKVESMLPETNERVLYGTLIDIVEVSSPA